MRISEKGIELIKHFEGLHDGNLKRIGLQPKMCPSGVWTVGWGYALINKDTGKWLKGQSDFHLIEKQYPEFSNMTIEQADRLLNEVLVKYELIVNRRVKVSITQNMFDALVSHSYNTGGSDTLFKLVNMMEMEDAAKWIEAKYITSNGKVMPGLIRRRKAESKLFLS